MLQTTERIHIKISQPGGKSTCPIDLTGYGFTAAEIAAMGRPSIVDHQTAAGGTVETESDTIAISGTTLTIVANAVPTDADVYTVDLNIGVPTATSTAET